MTSIDLVELNPFLDNKGQTALVNGRFIGISFR